MEKYNVRPTTCNECGSIVEFGQMKKYGIKPFQSGYCYHCTNKKCNAFVGTHRKEPRNALGILADGKTRRLRIECHDELERHYMSNRGKSLAYFKLSKDMDIKYEDCHFGHMTKQELRKALEIMQNWEGVYYR